MVRISPIMIMRVYKRHMTPEQRIEAAMSVADNPCVKSVTPTGRINLTDEFRESLYFAWKFRMSSSTIDRMLREQGLGWRVTGKEEKGKALHKSFRKRLERETAEPETAKPVDPEKEKQVKEKIEEFEKTKEELVAAGILKKRGRSYTLTDDFITKAESEYPEKLPSDILLGWGIYPDTVGLNLLTRLTERLERELDEQDALEVQEVLDGEGEEQSAERFDVSESQDADVIEDIDEGDTEGDTGEARDEDRLNAADSFVSENIAQPDEETIDGIWHNSGLSGDGSDKDDIISVVIEEVLRRLGNQHDFDIDAILRSTEANERSVEEGNSGKADGITEKSAELIDKPRRRLSLLPVTQPHPYVVIDPGNGSEVPSDVFFNEAEILVGFYDMDVILQAYYFSPVGTDDMDAATIKRQIMFHSGSELKATDDRVLAYRIRGNRIALMENAADRCFDKIREVFPNRSTPERKKICEWIEDLPKYPGGRFNTEYIIAKCGIPSSVYYRYVGDADYGLHIENRHKRDIDRVKAAFDYGHFKKGARQVCMLIPRLFDGERMSLNKVKRLMKKAGLKCDIRSPHYHGESPAKKGKKPNLLQRRFRLYRPNTVRVTDVTYLPYNDGKENQKAYGSAMMDPVTGRLIAFEVSGNNDEILVINTLRKNNMDKCLDGGIFHSDQGILYHVERFQKMVRRMGFAQSMSRLGNCWDNAVQESFFGHFKDECDYSDCRSVEDIRNRVNEYMSYYNEKRGMWHRGRMTPIEYEEYLCSLGEEEWAEYIKREEEAYKKMQEEAAKKAIENNRRKNSNGIEEASDE